MVPITDQCEQFGPWGLVSPSNSTQYFNSEQDAEDYMAKHPYVDTTCHLCTHPAQAREVLVWMYMGG